MVGRQGWLTVVSLLELFEQFLHILSLMVLRNRGWRGMMTSAQTQTAPQTFLQVLDSCRTLRTDMISGRNVGFVDHLQYRVVSGASLRSGGDRSEVSLLLGWCGDLDDRPRLPVDLLENVAAQQLVLNASPPALQAGVRGRLAALVEELAEPALLSPFRCRSRSLLVLSHRGGSANTQDVPAVHQLHHGVEIELIIGLGADAQVTEDVDVVETSWEGFVGATNLSLRFVAVALFPRLRSRSSRLGQVRRGSGRFFLLGSLGIFEPSELDDVIVRDRLVHPLRLVPSFRPPILHVLPQVSSFVVLEVSLASSIISPVLVISITPESATKLISAKSLEVLSESPEGTGSPRTSWSRSRRGGSLLLLPRYQATTPHSLAAWRFRPQTHLHLSPRAARAGAAAQETPPLRGENQLLEVLSLGPQAWPRLPPLLPNVRPVLGLPGHGSLPSLPLQVPAVRVPDSAGVLEGWV